MLNNKEDRFYRDIHKAVSYLERIAKSLERIEKNTFLYLPTVSGPVKECDPEFGKSFSSTTNPAVVPLADRMDDDLK